MAMPGLWHPKSWLFQEKLRATLPCRVMVVTLSGEEMWEGGRKGWNRQNKMISPCRVMVRA